MNLVLYYTKTIIRRSGGEKRWIFTEPLRRGKYPPLFADTEANNCFSINNTSLESFSHDLERKKKTNQDDTQTNWRGDRSRETQYFVTYLYLLVITCINYPMQSRV